jgi:hypothetical protein
MAAIKEALSPAFIWKTGLGTVTEGLKRRILRKSGGDVLKYVA